MRFPAAEQLHLPCRFDHVVPGARHADGRRYLPLIVLDLPAATPGVTQLGVVDRHHLVDPAHAGQDGIARIVFLLSTLRVQHAPFRQGLEPEPGLPPGRVSTAPLARGQVLRVLSWELQRGHLPYEALYAELLVDVGVGVVGVRTSSTAPDIAAAIGTAQVVPGDWLEIGRSRVDILGFEPGGVQG